MQDENHLRAFRRRLSVFLLTACLSAVSQVRAETNTVRIASQYGLAYLPLIVMEHDRLWEKQAAARGATLRVEYSRLGGGAALNDALLSDSVHLVAAGLAPLLLMWDRTIGGADVVGFAALNVSPIDVLTSRKGVTSLADLAADDRIALPAIKTSIQAIVLMAAAEKMFGEGQANRLDVLTVTMAHPDALAALLSGHSQITAYVSSSPFQDIALRKPGISKLTDSFAALGGPATFSGVYGKSRFAAENPIAVEAFYAAMTEALTLIAANRGTAIDEYLELAGETKDRQLVEEILARPEFSFGMAPTNTLAVAHMMYRFRILKRDPVSWKDYFARPLHDRQGS